MSQASLAEDLFAQLQGAPLQQVSRQLGIGQMQASRAVSAALPLLLGALGRNTAQPQGAEALFGARQRNHTGLDLGSVLGAVRPMRSSVAPASSAHFPPREWPVTARRSFCTSLRACR